MRSPGQRSRGFDKFRQLRERHPGVEAQVVARQARESGAKRRIEQQSARRRLRDAGLLRMRVPGRRIADSAKPGTRGHVRLEHRRHGGAEPQVRESDDTRRNARRPVHAARAHRGDTVDEFRFADRPHGLRTIQPIHRATFGEHGRHDVVPGVHVREQLVQQVAIPVGRRRGSTVPEMVVRVANRKIGSKRLLDRQFVPCRPSSCHFRPPCAGRARLDPALPGAPMGTRANPRRGVPCAMDHGHVRPYT